MSHFHNIVGSTRQQNFHESHVANGVFHFVKNHKLLFEIMENIQVKFKGEIFNEIGPNLWTSVIKTMFNKSKVESLKTEELEVLSSEYFYPAKSFEIRKLWTESMLTEDGLKTFMKDSFMVHFYGSQTNSLSIQRNSQHEVYAFLGPKYCPTSYWSSKYF